MSSKSISRPEMAQLQEEPLPMTTPHGFQKLPTELRLQIWDWALELQQPRRITFFSHGISEESFLLTRNSGHYPLVPALLHICRESRAVALKHNFIIPKNYWARQVAVFFNPFVDIFHFAEVRAWSDFFAEVLGIDVGKPKPYSWYEWRISVGRILTTADVEKAQSDFLQRWPGSLGRMLTVDIFKSSVRNMSWGDRYINLERIRRNFINLERLYVVDRWGYYVDHSDQWAETVQEWENLWSDADRVPKLECGPLETL